MISATYSPEDNKLRLRSVARLDAETYARVNAAGFKWAPAQKIFVAPKWTPEREDLAIELAGELEDEDTSLVDRAEERADRFEVYSEKRGAEAESARAAVACIAGGIPLGQPILVGHHSERRARKDAERIRSGTDKAIKLWQTSKYWIARAAGALRHAKYKELPAVRARRIKAIEADKRSAERAREKAITWGKLRETAHTAKRTRADGTATDLRDRVIYLANRDWMPSGTVDKLTRNEALPEDVQAQAVAKHAAAAARQERWIEHCDNRLAYERAMLAESGWTPPPKPKTKADLPLLNYAGTIKTRNPYHRNEIDTYEAHSMTKAEYAAIHADYKGTAVSECGTHRVRTALVWQAGARRLTAVYLTDSKTHERPGAEEQAIAADMDAANREAAMAAKVAQSAARAAAREASATARAEQAERDAPFEALKQAAKAGVKVVSAPQLFPTPPELAARMVELADIWPGQRVLEPSAGTGNLLCAIVECQNLRGFAGAAPHVVAVEISQPLALAIPKHLAAHVAAADFLSFTANDETLGEFDRIVMNPPFTRGSDVDHIRHAFQFLKPGGRLVALCADGPRQRDTLKPWAEGIGGTYEPLPEGSFKSEGTGVRVALLMVDAPSAVESEVA